MSVASPECEVFDAAGFPIRPPRPDFLRFCYELQGGPALPMESLAMRRIAAVWRGPGTWEERTLTTMRAAQAEGPTVWLAIVNAVVRQDDYDEARAKIYFAELRAGIDNAPSEATRKMRQRHFSQEYRAFITRHVRDTED